MSIHEVSMLVDQFKVKRKLLTEAKVGRPLRIKSPVVAYLPPLEKATYPNEAKINNYNRYQDSHEFKVILNCYISKHPHLQFVTFHRYNASPSQVIFYDTARKVQVAILVSEFREYNPSLVGGYKSIAQSLDDILEKR